MDHPGKELVKPIPDITPAAESLLEITLLSVLTFGTGAIGQLHGINGAVEARVESRVNRALEVQLESAFGVKRYFSLDPFIRQQG